MCDQTHYHSRENDSVLTSKANTFSAATHTKVALREAKAGQVPNISITKHFNYLNKVA